MGSPLSPPLAAIFMEEFEGKLLGKTNVQVLMWKRYVDDSLAVVRKGKEEELLDALNAEHRAIRFTLEKSVNESISFLDVSIKQEGGNVKTTVFRKPTATDRYLDFSSAHNNSIKWGIVSCMRRRAERVCRDETDLKKEVDVLRSIFKKNGYPSRTLETYLRGQRVRSKTGESLVHRLTIPYLPGISEKVRKMAGRFGVETRFARGRNLGAILTNNKFDGIEGLIQDGVIYKQECENCDRVYIGETGRRAILRKREHERDVRDLNVRSAIAEHCHNFDHKIDFNKFCIIDKEKNGTRRKIKESIAIMRNKTFNRDEGVRINSIWKSLLV